MTRTQIATADFSCGGMQKGTNGDESDERLRTENSYIDNRHKHTIIATLSVKKGSKFTDPDAQFPRGGALACARGLYFLQSHVRMTKRRCLLSSTDSQFDNERQWPLNSAAGCFITHSLIQILKVGEMDNP